MFPLAHRQEYLNSFSSFRSLPKKRATGRSSTRPVSERRRTNVLYSQNTRRKNEMNVETKPRTDIFLLERRYQKITRTVQPRVLLLCSTSYVRQGRHSTSFGVLTSFFFGGVLFLFLPFISWNHCSRTAGKGKPPLRPAPACAPKPSVRPPVVIAHAQSYTIF